MSDFKKRGLDLDVFGQPDNDGLGEFQQPLQPTIGSKKLTRNIEIDHIIPDLLQPRRIVPSSVHLDYRLFDSVDDKLMSEFFAGWIYQACEEMTGGCDAGDPEEYYHAVIFQNIEGNYLADDNLTGGLINRPLLELCLLAGSIYRNGLTNPITVAADGDRYIIETGERRWLAYWLLWYFTGDDQWHRIPARQVDTLDVFRQANENNQRNSLNEIERARQLSILIMEIYRQQGVIFSTNFHYEHEYYAQAADGERYPLTGHYDTIMTAMGVTSRRRIKQIRGYLRLPEEMWTLADDNDLSG